MEYLGAVQQQMSIHIRFDYAQAFALGFAVSFAVDQLPQRIADFIK